MRYAKNTTTNHLTKSDSKTNRKLNPCNFTNIFVRHLFKEISLRLLKNIFKTFSGNGKPIFVKHIIFQVFLFLQDSLIWVILKMLEMDMLMP